MSTSSRVVTALLRPTLRGIGVTGPSIHMVRAPAPDFSRAPRLSQATSERRYALWVQRQFPELYRQASLRARGMAGLGQEATPPAATSTTATSSGGLFSKIVDSIVQLAPQVLTYKQQQDINQIQLDRMRQGLPPLDASQYAPTVRIGVDQAQAAAAASAAWDAAKPFLIGGAALVGFLLLRKRRRR